MCCLGLPEGEQGDENITTSFCSLQTIEESPLGITTSFCSLQTLEEFPLGITISFCSLQKPGVSSWPYRLCLGERMGQCGGF